MSHEKQDGNNQSEASRSESFVDMVPTQIRLSGASLGNFHLFSLGTHAHVVSDSEDDQFSSLTVQRRQEAWLSSLSR
jgi:hypothetical protein